MEVSAGKEVQLEKWKRNVYEFEGDNYKSANVLCVSVTVTKHQFPRDKRKMKTAREKAPRVKGLKSALVRGRDIAVRKGKNPIGRAHLAPTMKLRSMVICYHHWQIITRTPRRDARMEP